MILLLHELLSTNNSINIVLSCNLARYNLQSNSYIAFKEFSFVTIVHILIIIIYNIYLFVWYIMFTIHAYNIVIRVGSGLTYDGRGGGCKSKYATACRRISLRQNNYMEYLCFCNLHIIIISTSADPYGKCKVNVNYKCSYQSRDFLAEVYENI